MNVVQRVKFRSNLNFRFPDHEELHEVIGYGGDVDYSSDEDDDDDRSVLATKPVN